jgi:uncharacterized protein YqjF (DUF2071 family)
VEAASLASSARQSDIAATQRAAFLTAEWRYLAMLNYRVSPDLLTPLVPRGTELDLWRGAAYVSVVGFLFKNTRVLGVPALFHRSFEEVNLRFYVRRDVNGEVRRGVTFIREIVPRFAVSQIARLAYNEPYRTLPMQHSFGLLGPAYRPLSVEYAWKAKGDWSRLRLSPTGNAHMPASGSEEEFIAHHQWGYTRTRFGGAIEYQVHHPAWGLWRATSGHVEGNLSTVYGPKFANALAGAPQSAFFTEGSAVSVHRPVRL